MIKFAKFKKIWKIPIKYLFFILVVIGLVIAREDYFISLGFSLLPIFLHSLLMTPFIPNIKDDIEENNDKNKKSVPLK